MFKGELIPILSVRLTALDDYFQEELSKKRSDENSLLRGISERNSSNYHPILFGCSKHDKSWKMEKKFMYS